MTHASLAALYRPQTFKQVTGQDTVTTVLSRAAAEDKVAPAYLLSGTRGVGKTTIARILAKALNCVQAPTSEPCNECEQCRKITMGNHVDVTEIDGASNNSVDDARALRENIGYAAMEGRYKVFIIDEAHMLSKSAFNALLKTLEEPPPRVVFIFATTEAHKFPITIVSRCQHFIFKRVSEEGLIAHLSRVLEAEKRQYEPMAVRLIAKRAAGSVRDSMSLLGQTLALGGDSLTIDNTRNVLGLAGQDLFLTLMQALATKDTKGVVILMQQLMDQGVDIGFFLRELTSLWRTLFLLREAGNAIIPSLNLAEDEARLWLEMAPSFSLTHLHAAWHMTLEAQRKVIHSPEPAAALELLLLNLALLPRLLPMEKVDVSASKTPNNSDPSDSAQQNFSPKVPTTEAAQKTESEAPKEAAPITKPEPKILAEEPKADINTAQEPVIIKEETPVQEKTLLATEVQAAEVQVKDVQEPVQEQAKAMGPRHWQGIYDFIATQRKGIVPSQFLRQATGVLEENTLKLHCTNMAVYDKLNSLHAIIETIASDYCGSAITLELTKSTIEHKPEATLKAEFSEREDMQPCLKILDATVTRVRPFNENQ